MSNNYIPPLSSNLYSVTIADQTNDDRVIKKNMALSDFNMEETIKKYSLNPAWIEGNLKLWELIERSSNDIGRIMYEKIANFVMNVADIDVCNLHALYSLASSIDQKNLFSFDLVYPQHLEYLMNLFSINKTILFQKGSVLNELLLETNANDIYGTSGDIDHQPVEVVNSDAILLNDAKYVEFLTNYLYLHLKSKTYDYVFNLETIQNTQRKEVYDAIVQEAKEYQAFIENLYYQEYSVLNEHSYDKMISYAAKALAEIAIKISYYRDTLKYVAQKYSIYGTSEAIVDFVGEKLRRGFSKPSYWRTGKFIDDSVPGISASNLQYGSNVQDFESNLYPPSGFKDLRVNIEEYYDNLEYLNIYAHSPFTTEMVPVDQLATSSYLDANGDIQYVSFTQQVSVEVETNVESLQGGNARFWENISSYDGIIFQDVISYELSGGLSNLSSSSSTSATSAIYDADNSSFSQTFYMDGNKGILSIFNSSKKAIFLINYFDVTVKANRLQGISNDPLFWLSSDTVLTVKMTVPANHFTKYYHYRNCNLTGGYIDDDINDTPIENTIISTGMMRLFPNSETQITFEFQCASLSSNSVTLAGTTLYYDNIKYSMTSDIASSFLASTRLTTNSFNTLTGTSEHSLSEINDFFDAIDLHQTFDRYPENPNLSGDEYNNYIKGMMSSVWDTFAVSGFDHNPTLPDLKGIPQPQYYNVPQDQVPMDGWIVPPANLLYLQRMYIGSEIGKFPYYNHKNYTYPTIAPFPSIWSLVKKNFNSIPSFKETIVVTVPLTSNLYDEGFTDKYGVTIDSWKITHHELMGYSTFYEDSPNLDRNLIVDKNVDRDGPFYLDALESFLSGDFMNTSGFTLSGSSYFSPLTEFEFAENAYQGPDYIHTLAKGFYTGTNMLYPGLSADLSFISQLSGQMIYDAWIANQTISGSALSSYNDELLSGYILDKYGVDVLGNHWMLYKTLDVDKKIAPLGTVFVRLKNWPLPMLAANISYELTSTTESSAFSEMTGIVYNTTFLSSGTLSAADWYYDNYSEISASTSGLVSSQTNYRELYEHYEAYETTFNRPIGEFTRTLETTPGPLTSESFALRVTDPNTRPIYIPEDVYQLEKIMNGNCLTFGIEGTDMIFVGVDDAGSGRIIRFNIELQNLDTYGRQFDNRPVVPTIDLKNYPICWPEIVDGSVLTGEIFDINRYVGYYKYENYIIFSILNS